MVRLQCPSCQNIIDAEPGTRPVCPRCGFTGPVLEQAGAAGTGAAGVPPGAPPPGAAPGYGQPPQGSAYGAHGAPAYGVPAAHGQPFGGFWIRVVSALIDGIILFPVQLGIQSVIAPGSFGAPNPWVVSGYPIAFGLSIVIVWLYNALLESSKHQATLGKLAVGLRVTDMAGRRISFLRATGRHFAKMISALILLIGHFMIGWTKYKQGLHDIMAGTLVYKKDHLPQQPPAGAPPAPSPPYQQ